jgi:hypothetical protein
MCSQLKSPYFALQNPDCISRLIDATKDAHRGVKGEREQLLTTLKACASKAELVDLIDLEEIKKELRAKSQNISGMKQIKTDATDLFEQIADRIYNIRCRIVHTK